MSPVFDPESTVAQLSIRRTTLHPQSTTRRVYLQLGAVPNETILADTTLSIRRIARIQLP